MRATIKSTDKLMNSALALPPKSRARLAEKLLTSLDEPNQKKVDDLWAAEAESRIDAFEDGKIKAISGEKVFRLMKFRKR